MNDNYLVVGKLRRPHGVGGEIQMDIMTDFPERLRRGITLFIGEEHMPLRIQRARWHNTVLLVHFEGYTSPEQVGELRNLFVYVSAGDRPPLPEGEYYHHELVGLQVRLESGEPLGVVEQILETGANDVLVLRHPDGKEILVPYHDEFVISVSLPDQTIVIRLIPGILEE